MQGSAARRYAYNSDEVNGIALSPNGRYLAAADDAGEVKVVDVRSDALHKTLRGGHSNIASGASAAISLLTCCLGTASQEAPASASTEAPAGGGMRLEGKHLEGEGSQVSNACTRCGTFLACPMKVWRSGRTTPGSC